MYFYIVNLILIKCVSSCTRVEELWEDRALDPPRPGDTANCEQAGVGSLEEQQSLLNPEPFLHPSDFVRQH